jgi:hypothetical protein
MVITDLDQRGPELERRLDLADHVIDNPRDVLLEEVGLESVERPRQVLSEKLQGMPALIVPCQGGGLYDLPMKRGNLLQDFVGLLGADFRGTIELDGQIGEPGHATMDFPLQEAAAETLSERTAWQIKPIVKTTHTTATLRFTRLLIVPFRSLRHRTMLVTSP